MKKNVKENDCFSSSSTYFSHTKNGQLQISVHKQLLTSSDNPKSENLASHMIISWRLNITFFCCYCCDENNFIVHRRICQGQCY